MKSVKIVVATHKKYRMPNDSMYFPLYVGAFGKEDIGISRDDVGRNISKKNPFFCELTGLYWAWHNLDAEYKGLVHYRRHFSYRKKGKNSFDSVLVQSELEELLKETDVILPKKRNYYIDSLYSHYKHTLYVEPLDVTGRIIEEKYPDYLPYFNDLKRRRSAHMFNIFIMKSEIFDGYCTWLFDILFELEKRIDGFNYDTFHSRFYGRISELLLDVYINKNCISYKEINFIYMEKVNKVKKIVSFFKAKFFGKKYDGSF